MAKAGGVENFQNIPPRIFLCNTPLTAKQGHFCNFIENVCYNWILTELSDNLLVFGPKTI